MKINFSRRISIYMLSLSSLLFMLILSIVFFCARTYMEKDTIRDAAALQRGTTKQIDNYFTKIETALQNIQEPVEHNLNNQDRIRRILHAGLYRNPIILDIAIAYVPYYFSPTRKYYCCNYIRNGKGKIERQIFGDDQYNYFLLDWYTTPYELGKPCWTEPFFSHAASIPVIGYSIPMRNRHGEIAAILTATIPLSKLTQEVERMKLYDQGYSIMLSKTGKFIVHPEVDSFFSKSIFTDAGQSDPKRKEDLYELGKDLISQKTGYRRMSIGGDDVYAFFMPIKHIGWSVVTVIPESVIFSGIHSLAIRIILLFFVGVILLYLLSAYIIRNLTKPLESLSVAAKRISKGDFDNRLPSIKAKDEIRTLYNSFDRMQGSLIDHMRLLRETAAAKERIESELNIAHEIQVGMVPQEFPPYPDRREIDIYASLKPAREVGGDFYDYFIQDNRLVFIIGDVSGKGVPASLVMAVSCSIFRAKAFSRVNCAADIVTELNLFTCSRNQTNMFITLFVGILDLETGILRFCNAGHNPPVICQGEASHYLSVNPHIPIGVFDDYQYKEEETRLLSKTGILVYTDGITEANSACDELFGSDRLLKLVKGFDKESTVKNVVGKIYESVKEHSVGMEQSDDISMVYIRFNK